MDSKKGVLLLNLGSPDSTSVSDVRKYLREFLMDERVLRYSYLKRWLIVNLFILPLRPKNSAEAYESIWNNGSPLIQTCDKLRGKIASDLDIPIELGMRYGSPSTENAIKALADRGVTEMYVIPLYPHYAMSSYETAVVKTEEVRKQISPDMKSVYMPPFYAEHDYIDAMLQVAKPYLEQSYDHLLFSYHGIPESHLKISDPTNVHCLNCENCCETDSPAHATCYRHQCYTTTRLFAAHAGLDDKKWSLSFQSRLGREPWLKPYTDIVLGELPKRGVKRLLVMSPAFVADNLETLEEIAMQGRDTFMEAGGESYELIPCLNVHDAWVSFLRKKIDQWS